MRSENPTSELVIHGYNPDSFTDAEVGYHHFRFPEGVAVTDELVDRLRALPVFEMIERDAETDTLLVQVAVADRDDDPNARLNELPGALEQFFGCPVKIEPHGRLSED